METIGINAWVCILQLVDLPSLLAFGSTCKFAHKLISEPASRDEILSKMKIQHIVYSDETKTTITKKTALRINPPEGILIFNSYEYKESRSDTMVTMGFFKGTSVIYRYFHSPGRCDNYILNIYNDENTSIKQVYFNASSHGTVSLSYQEDDDWKEFALAGECEHPEYWVKSLKLLQRILALTFGDHVDDIDSFCAFARMMKISPNFAILFLEPGPDRDKLSKNTYDIYQWLEGRRLL